MLILKKCEVIISIMLSYLFVICLNLQTEQGELLPPASSLYA